MSDDQPPSQSPNPDDSLGRAANRYVSFQIVSAVIGGILFLIVLFAVFLPMMNRVNQGANQVNQGFGPGGMPGGDASSSYSVNGRPATEDEKRSIDAAISRSNASQSNVPGTSPATSGQPPK